MKQKRGWVERKERRSKGKMDVRGELSGVSDDTHMEHIAAATEAVADVAVGVFLLIASLADPI
jgi:hypothetical protein